MPNRQCCICTAPLRGIGCRADPFPNGMCCEDCKDRYVDPLRVIVGPLASKNLLQILRSMAREARHTMEQRAINNAMAEVANLQIAQEVEKITDQLAGDAPFPSEQAIRDG